MANANNIFKESLRGSRFEGMSLDELKNVVMPNGVLDVNNTVANEWLSTIDNKLVGMTTLDFLNFRDNFFSKVTNYNLLVGDGYQVIGVDIVEPKDYNDPGTNRKLPDKQLYKVLHKEFVTEEKVYFQWEISMDIVQGAFTSIQNYNNFIGIYAKKLLDSVIVWKWRKLTDKLINPIARTEKLDMDPYDDKDPAKAAKSFVKQINRVAWKWTLPHTDYTADGTSVLTNAIPFDDLILFIDPELISNINVEVLATLFNSDKINPFFKMTVVPYPLKNNPKLTDKETMAVLIDKKSFFYSTRIETMATMPLPQYLMFDKFYHFWVRWGMIDFANAVRFTFKKQP